MLSLAVRRDAKGRALRDVLLFERGRVAWRARNLPEWIGMLFTDVVEIKNNNLIN